MGQPPAKPTQHNSLYLYEKKVYIFLFIEFDI